MPPSLSQAHVDVSPQIILALLLFGRPGSAAYSVCAHVRACVCTCGGRSYRALTFTPLQNTPPPWTLRLSGHYKLSYDKSCLWITVSALLHMHSFTAAAAAHVHIPPSLLDRTDCHCSEVLLALNPKWHGATYLAVGHTYIIRTLRMLFLATLAARLGLA